MSDPRPRLDQINLVAADVPASVEFYRLLGIEIPEVEEGWNAHHRSSASSDGEPALDLDIDSVGFAAHWGAEGMRPGPVLGFRLASRDAVDELYERLTAAGHAGVRAPYDAFFGIRYAMVLDPGGTPVGLMSEPSGEQRSAPPATEDFG
jgi:catechol 2,3-dioxygenase-like lactoylglutathione lyase family enzyme